jgi:hypothetical protein
VIFFSLTEQKIEKEIKAGRVAGPFNYLPLINLKVSPIGIVPKKTIGDFRLIHHLSYPESSSVNDFIDPKLNTRNLMRQYTWFKI